MSGWNESLELDWKGGREGGTDSLSLSGTLETVLSSNFTCEY